jgi:tetratricopeptide (TPR) repeat protein
MKSFQMPLACVVVFFTMTGAFRTNAAPAPTASATSNEVWSVFDRFVKEKHALAEEVAERHKVEMPSQVEDFFVAAQKRDWNSSSNSFETILDGAGMRPQSERKKWMPVELWGPVHDTFGTYELYHDMNPKFVKMLGTDIGKGIPAGSIYFGGTESGRFLASAFSQSHSEGRPFFTLTQNALADPRYLIYVADMYGDKIKVADTNDSQQSFSNYMADAEARILHDQKFPNEPRQVRPGEDVHRDAAGKVQVSGQVGIMAINALMVKAIFEKNPTREFYVEESFPLDWMFPHLMPSGVIMKINRGEIPELKEEVLKQDHEFWAKYSGQLVGNWITYDTPLSDVAAFVEKVYLNHDYSGFQGDVDFIHDEAAQKAFSKLRDSIAGIYSWRLGQPPSGGIMPQGFIATGANRKLIEREADFAFKQAWAFCPASLEAIYRYVQLLVNSGRVDDALLVAETGKKIDPAATQLDYLIKNLKSIKGQAGPRADLQQEIARLEKAVDENPTNVTQQFELAQKYVQAGQNEQACNVLDRVLNLFGLKVQEVTAVADAFNRLNQPERLAAALQKLTELKPESPEAWYDLAAARTVLGKTAPALDALKKALALNTKRLAQDSHAKDVRSTLESDPRFSKLRETPEFKALIAPQ